MRRCPVCHSTDPDHKGCDSCGYTTTTQEECPFCKDDALVLVNTGKCFPCSLKIAHSSPVIHHEDDWHDTSFELQLRQAAV